MSDEYQCAMCKGVFTKSWTDAEALVELEATFAVPVEDCELVCDDCYLEMFPAVENSHGPT